MIENNGATPRTPSQSGVREDGECSRRNSASSQLSSSTTSPNYDSGNISDLNLCLRPASLSSAEDDSISNDYGQHNKFQHLLREKDQSLFLALHDVRKLKSELERISKSEKWYKNELRSQKNSRMEILEKLYTNERKFTQENQRLENECIALYARCSEIEKQLQEEKESTTKILKNGLSVRGASLDEVPSRDFELEQHRQRLADQEQLIDMLRNQKRNLLKDLQKISCEKDDVILHLQKNIAQLEEENRTITKRCMQLVEAKIVLKDELLSKEADCNSMSNEVLDLQIIVKSLHEKLHAHIADLNQKEHEVNHLKQELSQKEHIDEIDALLQRQHQHELSEKEESIGMLNETISSLKAEIITFEDLRSHCDDQQREIDTLKRLVDERTSEIEELRRFNAEISKPSNENLQKSPETSALLKDENEKLCLRNPTLEKELNSFKFQTTSHSSELNNLRKTKQELEQLSEKYLEVCKLYEKSKFNLDMKDITVEKFKFEKEKDTREICTLRERLVEVLNKFECQKSLATEFEFALCKTQQEKRRLETENKCNMDKNLQLRLEANQSVRTSNDKDLELENLRTQLTKVEDMLNKHNAEAKTRDEITLLYEKDSSERRAALVQKLFALQSDKIQQLNAEQREWENLLAVIGRDDEPVDSDGSLTEFDNLNNLFDEQNAELMHINESFHIQTLNLRQVFETTEQENKTFQQALEAAKFKIFHLEKQVEALENSNVDYQTEIAHLAGTNERLIQDFNEDFSRERENYKKQTKQLQLEVKLRSTESEKLREEIQQLQCEVDRLNTSQAGSSQIILENSDSDSQRSEPIRDVQDRVLQNVIETEHRRKMSRYDVHIRSLLSNIKSYKKTLENAENRYDALLVRSKDMVDAEELRAVETNLQNMRVQFEYSQQEIHKLKHQLKTIREQFSVTDVRKNTSTMDLTNLMDDYKKLIQTSLSTARPHSTTEIYKLINKSNNFVPKLTNISTSINGLREDLQQMHIVMNLTSPAGRGSPQPKMSLMDELKLAEDRKMC